MNKSSETEDRLFLVFDICLISLTTTAMIASFFFEAKIANVTLAVLSFLGLVPVVVNAIKSLTKKKLSVDLLASIALIFSLLAKEWFSAAFITLMLAFARLFERITEEKAKKTIKSLMKYHVERVRLRIGDTAREVHISEVKPGDLVIVEAGDRMPVDGIVESGQAEVNESSLTGESELVPKKSGDRVFTSTINESGSLIVKTDKVGKDTTLARMIALVEQAGRDKNSAERAAEKFTQWYILLSLIASGVMYIVGLNAREILAVLLVVCADDIAVAVPLSFTAAMSHGAKRGVIVKGSSAFEQLSHMKFLLTDKTGTLTRGKPKVVDVKSYGSLALNEIVARFVGGASESGHAVSKAIMEYAAEKRISPHMPDESQEISGQGVSFRHDGENMLMGRLSFMENSKCVISESVRADIQTEKDAGRGIVCLAINGKVEGMLSYQDELRPRVKEIIAETKVLGVKEWHMLTGDNEKAAAAVAGELGIRHFHANMTPETKVEFIRKFEAEHSNAGTKSGSRKDPGKGIVGYMGDGVNDAASLALSDVSIAMGGIGADAAIEASDITIMKDKLDRLPETMNMAKKVMSVMRGNFWIWGITNAAGLALVAVGILGPAGAATYNFLTDFLPIGNALRAGKK
ncbi:cation-translocating P-type ATPase [Patescibacteria group bacterium]|nr:cation-translocating P-type ATPase [Patescibacteria group bacterium]MDE1946291.1 cation-translocating P-type ATPase [Patescibacteria group bacterium]MDE2010743.1 cation-translocating P-type ATPase [Patescibacteria group bacterium]MDE2232627.1 cation-translocating P-type ATPase [Patescibacteria group bacterium]